MSAPPSENDAELLIKFSPVVRSAADSLGLGKKVASWTIVQRLCKFHPEYGGGLAKKLVNERGPTLARQRAVTEWLRILVDTVAPVNEDVIHGRQTILGLAQIDDSLHDFLIASNFIANLRREVGESDESEIDRSQVLPSDPAPRLSSDQFQVPPATLELAKLFELAAALTEERMDLQAPAERFSLTFSSLLVAFLVADDRTSRWLAAYTQHVNWEVFLQRLHLQSGDLDRIAATTRESVKQPSAARFRLSGADRWLLRKQVSWQQSCTDSCAAILAAASNFAQSKSLMFDSLKRKEASVAQAATPYLDVRDVMGAYIYSTPLGHQSDYDRANLDRRSWSLAFLEHVGGVEGENRNFWREIHKRSFGSRKYKDPFGPSTRIATDIWTVKDRLGFRAYAQAIAAFIQHPEASAPLTISIQAPWGGGKTTLMRMVQKELDPEALDLLEEGKSDRGALRVVDALKEVQRKIRRPTKEESPKVHLTGETRTGRKRMTIWFNAWKYENTNQIWAGLCEAIVQQVADRLQPLPRELFWLQLNLRRIDGDTIRQKISERIFTYWWRKARGWLIGSVCTWATFIGIKSTAAATQLRLDKHLEQALAIGATGSPLVVLALLAYQALKANSDVKKEPAAFSFGELIQAPNYSAEVGFLHRAETDLRKVLLSVPAEYQPIVIFIDDLDRCSPAKVAQVVEAINLFLAGDLPESIFILGMDTEMAAAALEAAHKDMISCLPPDAKTPLGWRFMDKFVQLPFLIPPSEEVYLSSYAKTLFQVKIALEPKVIERAKDFVSAIRTRAEIDDAVKRMREERNLSENDVAQINIMLQDNVISDTLAEGIASFNDRDFDVQSAINAGAAYFGDSPRELKRFINLFRFNYYLWWARRAQEQSAPELDQLVRWTAFSMKWPEVARWCRRGHSGQPRINQELSESKSLTRLSLLENISKDTSDLASWQAAAATSLRLDSGQVPWLRDDDLFRFFRNEVMLPEEKRISHAAGRGLW